MYNDIKFNIKEIQPINNGNKYKVTIKIPMKYGWVDNVNFIVRKGYETLNFPMKHKDNNDKYAIFETEVELETRAIYHYYFFYQINNEIKYVKKINNDINTSINIDEMFKMSVNFKTPDWAKGKIMYHIFVDRFKRGSKEKLKLMPNRTVYNSWQDEMLIGPNEQGIWNADFYGGDLKGIEEELDYIKSLGVSILYLSPIVWSQSNHRYDTSDYENVDPYVGTNEDLAHLCQIAHRKGFKVILDAVFNHTGSDSKYFNKYRNFNTEGAYINPNSSYFPFYDTRIENNQIIFNYWWGMTNLPVCNKNSKEWQEYILGKGGIIDKWFSLGIDGLRLDVADELTDEFIEKIRIAVHRNKKDGFILGEVWENPMRVGRSYISSGKSMHSVMNYQLFEGLIKFFKYKEPHRLHYTLRDIQAEYPKPTIDTAMNFTSTHDFSRIMTLLGKKRFDPYHRFNNLDPFFKDKIIESLWEMGFNNNAIIELLNGKREIDYYQYRDLIEKLKWKGIYGDALEYIKSSIGFSPFDRGKKWSKDLPDDIEKDLEFARNYRLTEEEYLEARDVYEAYLLFLISYPGIFTCFYGDEIGMEGLNNLANRRAFPWGYGDKEIFKYFLSLGQFRNKYPFLKEAEFYLLDLIPEFVSFERIGENDKMFVAINNSDQERRIILPNEYKDGDIAFTLKKSKKDFLSPYGGVIIKK